MDPIETWHDAPEFERMEAKIMALEAEVARANDGIGYWTNQSADLVSQIELVNLECSALRDGIVDSNETISTLEAEVERLRKALKEIDGHHYLWDNFTLQLVHITNIAKSALEASDEYNAWDGCDALDSRPKTLTEGLRILADWFDAVYEDQGKNDEVQQDLRRWANDYEALEAKLAEFKREYPRIDLLIELENTNNRLKAKIAALVGGLKGIASQHLESEMEEEEDVDGADYRGAYDCIVRVARATLDAAKVKP